ncbi:unnamed protein product [Moneuplotes crassus]|uniref:Uncharacterized protein n=1 Tax=Euplotes crassus TaxID=5936 RepID=A0AAD1XJC2_EUPCR|nr:unnamed protein product [Moneuplotes crassus]
MFLDYYTEGTCEHCQSIAHGKSFHQEQQERMKTILFEKYRTSVDIYNVKLINEIIFNRPVKITSIFKDYLVNDEIAEFLKKFYTFEELKPKMKKLVEFFMSYFKIFPNYVVIECLSHSEKFDFGLFKNIERKQRVIDEKLYIAAQNKAKRERKQERKNKLTTIGVDSFIRVEDDFGDSDFDYTKMFTDGYYQEISTFKKQFKEEKVDIQWYQSKIKELTSNPRKVFDYGSKSQNPKPVILSRNIIDFVSTRKISPTEKSGRKNGWTKLFNFFSDDSCTLNYKTEKDISLSISNAWEKEEVKCIPNQNFGFDSSRSASKMKIRENIKKYSIETLGSKDISTNLATTSENASVEKNRIIQTISKNPSIDYESFK